MSRTVPAGLISVDYETLSLSDSTALGFNSTVVNQAAVLDLSVETNNVRYRADGTDPTLTTGVLIPVGFYRLEGFNGTSDFKLQRQTGSAKVSVQAYKYPGSGSRA